jgi:hypothetical protein
MSVVAAASAAWTRRPPMASPASACVQTGGGRCKAARRQFDHDRADLEAWKLVGYHHVSSADCESRLLRFAHTMIARLKSRHVIRFLLKPN